jgi:hypothetical protein
MLTLADDLSVGASSVSGRSHSVEQLELEAVRVTDVSG